MANNKSNVSVGKPKVGGAVWRAPAGTAVPVDADAVLAAAFECMGYVSSDGLKNANSKEHTEIKAWGGDTVAIPLTGHNDAFSGDFIESLNPTLLKAVHGDGNVSGDLETGISISVDATDDTEHVYVIDQELRGGTKKRIVIPCGIINEIGEVTYKDDTVISYPITITALPDNNEKTHYEYIKRPATT